VLPNLKPTTRTISLRLPQHLLDSIKDVANARDVPYQSLIKVWLQETVHSHQPARISAHERPDTWMTSHERPDDAAARVDLACDRWTRPVSDRLVIELSVELTRLDPVADGSRADPQALGDLSLA